MSNNLCAFQTGDKTMKVNPAIQAANLIRYIGDEVTESGEPIHHLHSEDFYREIGSPSQKFAAGVMSDLCEQGIIKATSTTRLHTGGIVGIDADLTLGGWELYEAEKRGQTSGDYGFLAMEFGDAALEDFVGKVVKPIVKKELSYDLVDMRDVSQAGIIDNIMRVKIRDAAFVIADLTHDNRGAYWEAGYAERLGKPVVYICEQQKFGQEKTHFDTNHCTTIPWFREESNHDDFKQKLIATLRRSLDQ